jgi:hypothetical protein
MRSAWQTVHAVAEAASFALGLPRGDLLAVSALPPKVAAGARVWQGPPRDSHSSLKSVGTSLEINLVGWGWICSRVENVTRCTQYTAKQNCPLHLHDANRVRHRYRQPSVGIG